MFTINIFPTREAFIAIYIGLQKNYTQSTIQYLSHIIKRSKNPPVSVIYTYQLLKKKSPYQYALDIIRFVSQLADLSKGTSISESLQILNQGNFLSQIRHSLTHKNMVCDSLIFLARQLVIKQLMEKYWKAIYEQIISEGLYDDRVVEQEFKNKYGQNLVFESKKDRYFGGVDLIQMKIYEYKKKIGQFLRRENEIGDVINLCKNLTQFKRSVLLSQCLKIYSENYKQTYFFQLILKIFKQNLLKLQTLNQPYILKKLKKIYFFKFIKTNKKILEYLPQDILSQIQKPFINAKIQNVNIY